MPGTAIAPIDCRDVSSSLQACCCSSRVCQQFSGLQSQHTLQLQRFPTVTSWEATKVAKLNPVNEILLYAKVLCLWTIFAPSTITMVGDMNINRNTTDHCAYMPFLFGMVSQPDNHRDNTRRLDCKDFVAYFAEDYTADIFWSYEAQHFALRVVFSDEGAYLMQNSTFPCTTLLKRSSFDTEVSHKVYAVWKEYSHIRIPPEIWKDSW